MGLHCLPQSWLSYFPMVRFYPSFPFSGPERTFKPTDACKVQALDRKSLFETLGRNMKKEVGKVALLFCSLFGSSPFPPFKWLYHCYYIVREDYKYDVRVVLSREL